jgi:hypothetical protein
MELDRSLEQVNLFNYLGWDITYGPHKGKIIPVL